MKKPMLTILCIGILFVALCGCDTKKEQSAAELIQDIPTTQYFTDEAVSDEDTEKILWAGVNAPSAMNGQKWHFTAVTDKDVLQEISDSMSMGMPGGTPPKDMKMPEGTPPKDMKMPEGTPPEMPTDDEKVPAPPTMGKTVKAGLTDAPLAIIISCSDGSNFDAGLACQNMSAEAQLLGYGSKIISSTTIALNGERKAEFDEMLSIPDGYSAVAVLLVGKEDTSIDETMDGYTSATPRNPFDEVVTYVK